MSSLLSRSRHILETSEPKYSHLEEIYEDLHQHPELSLQESRTAGLVAAELEPHGFDIHRNVGGHGVVAVLENHGTATVLLRADMDALPVLELTNLPYASHAQQIDVDDGVQKPVMRACGHDMHTTCLLGAAAVLAAARSRWSGTLICLFQPNEERSGGALAMVQDGLYDKVPFPDVCLAQHVAPNVQGGKIALRSGSVMAGVESWEICIYASRPQSCINPITIASRIISKLSNYNSPSDDTLITCGSLQAGDAYNVIPSEATLKLEVRTYDPQNLHSAVHWMKQVIEAECHASQTPLPPRFTCQRTCPPTTNDQSATDQLLEHFRASFSPDRVHSMEKDPGCEDFPHLLQSNKPGGPRARGVFWNIGSVEPAEWDRRENSDGLGEIPGLHSAYFAPSLEITLTTGVEAMIAGALCFLD